MEGLKIKLKIEEMIQYGYAAVRHFPKSERHVLAHASHAKAEGFVRSVIYDIPWESHHAPVRD